MGRGAQYLRSESLRLGDWIVIIVRKVAEGVLEHFPVRRSEWVLACILFAWGWLLLLPGPIFNQSPAWAGLQAWAPEHFWGWAAVLLGAGRFIALMINGTFHETWYGRYSPHVRCAAAFLCCLIWFQLSWGLLTAPHLTTGLAIYPGLFVLDFTNIMTAVSDAGKTDKAKKDGL